MCAFCVTSRAWLCVPFVSHQRRDYVCLLCHIKGVIMCALSAVVSFVSFFLVPFSSCFLCLARCGFRLLPSFRWDAPQRYIFILQCNLTLCVPFVQLLQSKSGERCLQGMRHVPIENVQFYVKRETRNPKGMLGGNTFQNVQKNQQTCLTCRASSPLLRKYWRAT